MIRIAGATVNQIPLDWKTNTSNIIAAISEAKVSAVRILCLPELCITGYGCEDWFLSDWVCERAIKELKIIRDHCENITVAVGLPVRVGDITYNGACVISNRQILGITCKQFLARDGVHYEPRWFTPWIPGRIIQYTIDNHTFPMGDVQYMIDGITIGFEICEDAWHKTMRPGYRLLEKKIQLILNPSASHFAMRKSITREQELAVDGSRLFSCAYVFANLLGNEAGRMIYDGDIIIAQNGTLLAVNKRMTFCSHKIFFTDIDFLESSKSVKQPFADSKDVNEELTQALSLALFDYLRKSKAKGFVLSLSGGADSSSCAVFVAEMIRRASSELGWEKFYESLDLPAERDGYSVQKAAARLLTCAYQGTRNSSPITLHAAKTLAESIGAGFHQWTIDDEVNSYSSKIEKAIERKLTWEEDDIALQNIQARARSPIIWMLANIKRSVLLTTSNRSEGDVGYATMDGDTSGSLAPIAGLSKVFILQWLKWAERELKYAGLAPVNQLQPTAELRPQDRQQTDETDLMPYPILVEIEHHAISNHRSPMDVYKRMKKGNQHPDLKRYIQKFFRLWAANQWEKGASCASVPPR
jgi:NAD+ synthase (glutamine-hydrolysing)